MASLSNVKFKRMFNLERSHKGQFAWKIKNTKMAAIIEVVRYCHVKCQEVSRLIGGGVKQLKKQRPRWRSDILNGESQIWLFSVVVLQTTAKKWTKVKNSRAKRAKLLFLLTKVSSTHIR